MARSGSDVEAALRLDREAIEAVDASDLLTDVLALPEHLRDALWKVESAQLEPWDSPGGLVVAGMGGSAIGGALARAALGDQRLAPDPRRARLRPAGRGRRPTPPCSARRYSGNTEETLACYEAAGALGARRVVVTTRRRARRAARARTASR